MCHSHTARRRYVTRLLRPFWPVLKVGHASGHAEERRGSSFINKTSYVENCETSAWGRALGNFGIGLDTSVASYDEVANAIKNQTTKAKVPTNTTKLKLVVEDDNWDKVLKYVA